MSSKASSKVAPVKATKTTSTPRESSSKACSTRKASASASTHEHLEQDVGVNVHAAHASHSVAHSPHVLQVNPRVKSPLLLGIGEHRVGLADLLELGLGLGHVLRVPSGVLVCKEKTGMKKEEREGERKGRETAYRGGT